MICVLLFLALVFKCILTLILGSIQKLWHIQPGLVLLVHDSLAGFLILQRGRASERDEERREKQRQNDGERQNKGEMGR